MICECPKPRYSNQIENGVLYFVASGKTHGIDGEKDMREVNLFSIKGDTVQDLESGQSRWEKAKSLITKNFEGS